MAAKNNSPQGPSGPTNQPNVTGSPIAPMSAMPVEDPGKVSPEQSQVKGAPMATAPSSPGPIASGSSFMPGASNETPQLP